MTQCSVHWGERYLEDGGAQVQPTLTKTFLNDWNPTLRQERSQATTVASAHDAGMGTNRSRRSQDDDGRSPTRPMLDIQPYCTPARADVTTTMLLVHN